MIQVLKEKNQLGVSEKGQGQNGGSEEHLVLTQQAGPAFGAKGHPVCPPVPKLRGVVKRPGS